MNIPFFIFKYKLHQFFFWLLLFGVWYFLRYQDYATGTRAFQVTLVKVIDLAVMICITNYLLIPKLLYKKHYAWFVACLVILVVSSSLIKMNILGRIMNSPQLFSLSGNLKVRVYDNVIPHFLLVIAGAAIKLMSDYAKLQQRVAAIAKDKAEAELNFLKSQINPHFLFNSLNAVYFLIDKENAGARDALHKFSEMLRYQLYEMNDSTIPIEKEIKYLQDYIDLQKLRNEENFSVTFTCLPVVKNFFIEPLLLIPFVENSFKHISHLKDQLNFVDVSMDFWEGQFWFFVKNSIDPGEHGIKSNSGIGLTNVKRRLALIYPDKHELTIKNTNDVFQVELCIQL